MVYLFFKDNKYTANNSIISQGLTKVTARKGRDRKEKPL